MVSSDLRRADLFIRGAATKAWTALVERRLPLSPTWWLKALALHWNEVAHAVNDSAGRPQSLDRPQLDLSYQEAQRAAGRAAASSLQSSTRVVSPVSIVALVHSATSIQPLMDAVRRDTISKWDLTFVAIDEAEADRTPVPVCEIDDARINSVRLRGLVGEDGTWLPPGHGDYVVLLGPNTLLADAAIGRAIDAIRELDADWLYTDDDRLDGAKGGVDPYLKGAFSPELALFDDYATRLAVARRKAIESVGGLRAGCQEAQIYDLLLRIAASGGVIRHVPLVGCHRLDEIPPALGPHHRAAAARMLAQEGISASVELSPQTAEPTLMLSSVQWPADLLSQMHVTIVVPTRDRADLLARSVESVRRTVDPRRVRLLIMDDRSSEPATARYLATLEGDSEFRCRVVRPAASDASFNYARLMNAAAREVDTELMLHLNNDIEAVAPGWLDRMAGWLLLRDIGVVGAKLLYPDGAIQHAGVIVSPAHGAPGHLFRGLADSDKGYQWLPHRARNVSAVTGACMLTRTQFFRDLGGFDADHLGVQFNDTDFCLRAIAAGKRVVYEPSAVLLHLESASRGREYDYRETLFFLEKYRDYRDPFASSLLEIASLYGPTPVAVS